MTVERLYYDDSYLREFEAAVVRVETRGPQQAVWLEKTAFYPTSGGQPFDLGTLNGARVVGVETDEASQVVHFVEPVDGVERGQVVRGVIDWARRFDHMQQHTGQHILSAAFERLFAARTIGFHLGAEGATIDVTREMTVAELSAAEHEANRVVWEDRPVGVRYVTADEAEQLPLRKESARTGTLRLVEIQDYDLSACGGTHVARTGAVGMVAIEGAERAKGGHRLQFVCGRRVQSRFRQLLQSASGAARLLSVMPEDLASAIERLQAEGRQDRRRIVELDAELTRYRADGLVQTAQVMSRGRLVLYICSAEAAGLKTLALSIVSRPGLIAVLVSGAQPALVVVARASDVGLAANDVVAALTREFGGRGGGKPDLAQAGGLHAPAETILERARELVAME